MNDSQHKIISRVSFFLVPLLFVIIILIYLTNSQLYCSFTDEDGLLEWLTFIFLFIAGLISFVLTVEIKKYKFPYYFFFLFFSIFLLFSAMEEISWGQRIFDIKSPSFFIENSDQGETNIHNLFQKWGRSLSLFGIDYNFLTKHYAGLTLLLYGACLPVIAKNQRVAEFLKKKHIVVPPLMLSLSFILAALMMIDKPTGSEEEIGEFLFSICLLLFILMEYLNLKRNISSKTISN